MAKGDDLRERLVDFAVMTLNLCEQLPKTPAGAHVSLQLLRSATSAAPNYAEARGAESYRDFIHKLGIAIKELNEAEVWLDIVLRKELLESKEVQAAHEECGSLCRILAASVRTANAKVRKRGQTDDGGG
jgi:four helix bundle protein